MVIKDSATSPHWALVLDPEDRAVIRSDAYWRALFADAGARLVRCVRQRVWPDDLFPAVAWVIGRPEDGGDADADAGADADADASAGAAARTEPARAAGAGGSDGRGA
jgi:hypothetical protein